GIKKPYFLFVGTREPRKNLITLIQAWKIMNSKTHDLVITGTEGNVFAQVASRASSVPYIPDDDLPALYSGAAAFVFPSLYEGFGLPILEALACGTPVIASDTLVFTEIFEDAVLPINPLDPKEIANAMQTVVEDKMLASDLRGRGLQKAAQFSWDKSAQSTRSIIESIL
ncbi:MAG: glycosyltransferase family 1 protein, partial [Legionella sp.]|nr:glycosyltransferase family 1 protein [Legionella sp.]